MPKRVKRVNLSKEDVARTFDVRRKQTLVQKELYPALVAATTSVEEAKALTQAISSIIMGIAMNVLKERKMSEIKSEAVKQLCEEGREQEITDLLTTLDGESLFSARSLIEGSSSVLEQAIKDEMSNRTLKSLEFDWSRMMQI